MKVNYEEFKKYFEDFGIDVPVRKWEYDLEEEELKKRDFQKWWYIYKFDFKKEKEDDIYKYKKFREKTGLYPLDYFSNLYRDKLIEIINSDDFKENWNWNECYKKYKKIDEENCLKLREMSNEDIASEIIENADSDFLLKILDKCVLSK